LACHTNAAQAASEKKPKPLGMPHKCGSSRISEKLTIPIGGEALASLKSQNFLACHTNAAQAASEKKPKPLGMPHL